MFRTVIDFYSINIIASSSLYLKSHFINNARKSNIHIPNQNLKLQRKIEFFNKRKILKTCNDSSIFSNNLHYQPTAALTINHHTHSPH